jgi:hypothetical protein
VAAPPSALAAADFNKAGGAALADWTASPDAKAVTERVTPCGGIGIGGGCDRVGMDELFPALVGGFGAHGFAGFEERGAVEPGRQPVGMPGQRRRLADDRAEHVLADFPGHLPVAGAAQGHMIDESEIAGGQLAERGFIAMAGESYEQVGVGFLHVLLPYNTPPSPVADNYFGFQHQNPCRAGCGFFSGPQCFSGKNRHFAIKDEGEKTAWVPPPALIFPGPGP